MIILTHEILDLVTDNNAFIVLVKSIAKRASYQDQSCFPSIATMEKDTGFSKNTVINGCKWLRENGIIQVINRKNEKGGDTSNFYVVETDLIKIIGKLKTETPVQNLNTPSAEFEHPPVQNLNTNHKDNLTTSSINQKKEKFSAENYVQNLDLNLDLKNILLSWLEIRKTKKTATTQKSIDLALKTLNQFDLQTQIKMVENSILNGWTGIFEIKQQTGKYSDQEKTYQQNSALLQAQKEAEKQAYDTLPQIEPEIDLEAQEKARLQKQLIDQEVQKIKEQLDNNTYDFSKTNHITLKLLNRFPDNYAKAQIIYGNLNLK